MKILFDTNIVLDAMLNREPFAEQASQLMTLIESSKISGLLCATTVTTIHYLSTKIMGTAKAQNQIKNLLMLFEIAAVNRSVIGDTVLYQAARHVGAEAIVTRDLKGFKGSILPIYNPDEMLTLSLANL